MNSREMSVTKFWAYAAFIRKVSKLSVLHNSSICIKVATHSTFPENHSMHDQPSQLSNDVVNIWLWSSCLRPSFKNSLNQQKLSSNIISAYMTNISFDFQAKTFPFSSCSFGHKLQSTMKQW
jgi:hypothetical protein